jgi:hypothetical protein
VNSCNKGADKHQPKNQSKPDLRKIRITEKIHAVSSKRRFSGNEENNCLF